MPMSMSARVLVLRGYDAGEYDRNLALYVSGLGRVFVLAKGLNSPKSGRKAIVQSGNILKAQLTEFHGKYLLQEATLEHSVDWYGSSASLAGVIFHILELIDVFAAGFENTDQLINMYKDFTFAFRMNPRQVMVRVFELKILEKLGFFPSAQMLSGFRENAELVKFLRELVSLNFTDVDKIAYETVIYRRIEVFLQKYLEHTAERKLHSQRYFLN
jgi:recombinational DNA repair protein (RecF pathway)